MVFTWALVKTVTSGEIDIIKWNVPNRCFCLSPIICENPRQILLATGGKFLQLTQLQDKVLSVDPRRRTMGAVPFKRGTPKIA